MQQEITPKKQFPTTPQKSVLFTKGNQSTNIHSPPHDFCQRNPWKTPKSHLKANTPESLFQSSPYSDRYIPLRADNVSRNLFHKQIQPFEVEEEKGGYQELLSENVLEIDENKPTILKFHQKDKEQKNIQQQQKHQEKRKIDPLPYKVLDAPDFDDDFYQDTLHWGKNNLIAVGLSRSIYLYNVDNSKVLQIAGSRSVDQTQAYYTSLQWNTSGTALAIGCYDGVLKLWDYNKQMLFNELRISQSRIGTISWANPNVLACGCKDKSIVIGDARTQAFEVCRLQGHTQEVCGVSFDGNENQLASGGNDNKVIVWQMRGGSISNEDRYSSWEINSHKAAVRALAWNPNSSGILATGGGSQDKTIQIHSTLTNKMVHNVFVDSQVCKLRFSRSVNELVSTHGYEKNLICIWQYPQMKKLHQLEGHSERVLQLSVSPDESTILTGSGDETLKFWKVFPSLTSNCSSALFSMCEIR